MSRRRYLLILFWIAIKVVVIIQLGSPAKDFVYEGF